MFTRCPQLARPAFLRQPRSHRLLTATSHSPKRLFPVPSIPRANAQACQHLCFQTFPASLPLGKSLNAFFSAKSRLFLQNTGGGIPTEDRSMPSITYSPLTADLFASLKPLSHSPSRLLVHPYLAALNPFCIPSSIVP